MSSFIICTAYWILLKKAEMKDMRDGESSMHGSCEKYIQNCSYGPGAVFSIPARTFVLNTMSHVQVVQAPLCSRKVEQVTQLPLSDVSAQ
jgi:hypothetical protein